MVDTRARPASHVWNASVDVRRRTRWNAYSFRGAAPELNHWTPYRGLRGSASLPSSNPVASLPKPRRYDRAAALIHALVGFRELSYSRYEMILNAALLLQLSLKAGSAFARQRGFVRVPGRPWVTEVVPFPLLRFSKQVVSCLMRGGAGGFRHPGRLLF